MEKYNLVILHYDSGTVEFVNVPDVYRNDPAEYVYEIMDLNDDNISWMYSDNLEIVNN